MSVIITRDTNSPLVLTPKPIAATATTATIATTTTMAATMTTSSRSISVAMQRRKNLLMTVDKLRDRARQVLKCVINLHIEFLVLDSNVSQLLDDIKSINNEYMEMRRLDKLIETLRDYNGPIICHEWPYPLIFEGTIDEANIAQMLNTTSTTTNNTLTLAATNTANMEKIL